MDPAAAGVVVAVGAAAITTVWSQRAAATTLLVVVAGCWVAEAATEAVDAASGLDAGGPIGPAITAAALAGHAVVVAAGSWRRRWSAPTALAASGVLGVLLTVGDQLVAGRRFALGVLLAAAAALVPVWSSVGSGRLDRVAVRATAIGGLASLVGGLAVRDGDWRGAAVVVGAGLIVAASVRAPVLLPVAPIVVLAVVRTAASVPTAVAERTAEAAGPSGVAVVIALLSVRRRGPVPVEAAAAAAFGAAGVLSASMDPDVRAAAVLVAAGAVWFAVSGHGLGAVALVPGLVGLVAADALPVTPEAAAAGAAVVAIVWAAGASRPAVLDPPALVRAAPAVTFAVVPVWGWAGAATGAWAEAVPIVVATASCAVVALAAPTVAAAAGTPGTGKLMLRRARAAAGDHGLPQPPEDHAEAGTASVVDESSQGAAT